MVEKRLKVIYTSLFTLLLLIIHLLRLNKLESGAEPITNNTNYLAFPKRHYIGLQLKRIKQKTTISEQEKIYVVYFTCIVVFYFSEALVNLANPGVNLNIERLHSSLLNK